MQDLEVMEDVVVNVIVARRLLKDDLFDLVRIGNPQARERHMALVPNGHRRLAEAVHDDVTVIVNRGHAFVAAVVLGPARHVLLAAVRKDRRHDQLLFGVRAQ